MRSTRHLAAALTFAVATLVGATTAQASEAGACSANLSELSDLEVTLDGLVAARAEGEALRRDLRVESFDLAVAIERVKLEGGNATVVAQTIAKLQSQRAALTAELAASEKLAPVLIRQIAVLSADVDASSRAYVVCVEASIG